MDDLNEYTPQPIPEEFHSEYEERPFLTCTRCGETLSDFPEGFQIAKVFRREEVVFEYAICSPCHTSMIDEFSMASRQTLEDYYNANMTPGLGAGSCGICQLPRKDLPQNEFSLGAACVGSQLLEAFMICSSCMEVSNLLVSKQTQGIWNDFIDTNFPGVPEDSMPCPTNVGLF
ncbi:MAG: hypothetical protein GY899_08615 [Verrucomicrobiaceae bacterium]|nr:hypothetical protein [Verrucomicrobiaceae bacterium]